MSQIYVVERHHEVLPAWAQYRRSLRQAPVLVTLDHHTDTSPPFRRHLGQHASADAHLDLRTQWLREIDFREHRTLVRACERLNNDEHIVTAIASDIVSAAMVVAHNAADTGASVFQEHRIVCRGVDVSRTNVRAEDCARVLESDFLHPRLKDFDAILRAAGEQPLGERPYILDIDLDYFNTLSAVQPQDAAVFRSLVAGAGLVTIATEPEYVRNCALEAGLNSELLLQMLRERFLASLSELHIEAG